MFIVYLITAAFMVASTLGNATPTNFYFMFYDSADCSGASTSMHGIMLNECVPDDNSDNYVKYTYCDSESYTFDSYTTADCSGDVVSTGVDNKDDKTCYDIGGGMAYQYHCDDHSEPWTLQPNMSYHTE